MTDTTKKPRGLGRGLSALMADVKAEPADTAKSASSRADVQVPIEQLVANPNQPRRRFDPQNLQELTASIREKGILQPLIVRQTKGGKFEIVAGERRWRAAQQAQLHEVPVLVRDFNDTEVLEVAIIENVQRADLNPVEEAAGYRQLMDSFGHTQEKLADALGKSRSHIANLLRLLTLPGDVLEMLQSGKLSAGHARALVVADNPSVLASEIVRRDLSVRATEALVKKQKAGENEKAKPPNRKPSEKDADTRALEGDLSANLGMKVRLSHATGKQSGEVSIRYDSLDDLDKLCRLLSGN